MPGKSSAESLLISVRQVIELYAFAVQLRELVDQTGKLRIKAASLGIIGEPLRELLDDVIRLRIEAVGICNQLEERIGKIAPGAVAAVKTKSMKMESTEDEKTPTQIARPCKACYSVVYPSDTECRVCGHKVVKESMVRKKEDG